MWVIFRMQQSITSYCGLLALLQGGWVFLDNVHLCQVGGSATLLLEV